MMVRKSVKKRGGEHRIRARLRALSIRGRRRGRVVVVCAVFGGFFLCSLWCVAFPGVGFRSAAGVVDPFLEFVKRSVHCLVVVVWWFGMLLGYVGLAEIVPASSERHLRIVRRALNGGGEYVAFFVVLCWLIFGESRRVSLANFWRICWRICWRIFGECLANVWRILASIFADIRRYSPIFADIRRYSPIFANIRHYSSKIRQKFAKSSPKIRQKFADRFAIYSPCECCKRKKKIRYYPPTKISPIFGSCCVILAMVVVVFNKSIGV